ncbi:MAG: CapA family protein [Eggerthellaceae bacterium]|nr:CapA family protein [Eggerthellaceae bacterium]
MASSRGWKIAAVLMTVLLLAVIACGAYLLMGGFGGSGFGRDLPIEQTVELDSDGPSDIYEMAVDDVAFEGPAAGILPAKLAGSTETVDEDGIVHGVTPDGIRYTVHGRGVSSQDAGKVTLVAAGDQIATDNSMPIADAYAGSVGDGKYDFTPFYQDVAPFIGGFDLRYINQETVMAGADRGFSGYPVFNGPDAQARAIADVGFNLVNFATNHTYDMGLAGIERSHAVWEGYPELLIGGSYLSQEDRETVHMIERNGITFAFLAYTYGDNHYGTAANFPNSYYVCGFDKALIEQDVRRAQEVADAVIVSMHWGSEYTVEPNAQQEEYARFLADLDVDLVLGSHAHIMQPTKYVTGDTGNTVLVIYGLSDFVSGWTLTDCILSGLFTCDFVWNGEGVDLENPVWYPAIEWSDGGDVRVRMLKDMTEAEIDANTRTRDVGNDSKYLRDFLDAAGMEIPVVM